MNHTTNNGMADRIELENNQPSINNRGENHGAE